MLKEIVNCCQKDGEPFRRWFTDASMDLIVWFNDADEITAFQLCYGKPNDEHALTWRRDTGFSHNKVDTGEMYGIYSDRLTPILVPDGNIDLGRLRLEFVAASTSLDAPLTAFIMNRLQTSLL